MPYVSGIYAVEKELFRSWSGSDKAKRDLLFRSMDGSKFGFGNSQVVSLIDWDDDYYYLPRRYAYANLPAEILDATENRVSGGSPITMDFNEELQASRPELKQRQDVTVNEVLHKLQTSAEPFAGGLLQAACGTGKTLMAMKIAQRLGVTTLVLVHKEFLMDQFIDTAKRFLFLEDEDIGIVQQKRVEYEGKKVVIAMIQSVLSKEYEQAFYDWAGLVILDESHIIGAPLFNESLPKFSAKYTLGLTATPRRGDGLQPVFEERLGPILSVMAGKSLLTADVYQMLLPCRVPEGLYKWKDKTFLGKLVTALTEDGQRNQYLAGQFIRALKAGRKILVLSDRREHLEELRRLVEDEMKNITIGFYWGGLKKAVREQAATCDLILSTYSMSCQGLDIPDLDTLFLATPKSDVEQSVGRILRHHDEKKQPIVVDLVDDNKLCVRFAFKRLNQYRTLGFEIKQPIG